jgi:hypothetical protein
MSAVFQYLLLFYPKSQIPFFPSSPTSFFGSHLHSPAAHSPAFPVQLRGRAKLSLAPFIFVKPIGGCATFSSSSSSKNDAINAAAKGKEGDWAAGRPNERRRRRRRLLQDVGQRMAAALAAMIGEDWRR